MRLQKYDFINGLVTVYSMSNRRAELLCNLCVSVYLGYLLPLTSNRATSEENCLKLSI